MTKPTYSLWFAEQKNPTPEDRRSDRTTIARDMSGFWRIESARLKPDYPVSIWTQEGESATIFQIGRKLMDTINHEAEWQDFCAGTWLHCVAVSESDWHVALDTGRWPSDGKAARQFTEAEKLAHVADIIPDTPAEEGGNAEGLTYDQQIDVKMKAEIAKHDALGKIDTQEKAQKAAAILEAIQALGKLGNARREADRLPHLTAAAAVQNLWQAILTPGASVAQTIKDAIQAFKVAEQRRLQAIADEAARVERKRLQDIADAEAEERRKALQKQLDDEAAQRGEAAEQVEVVAEQVEVKAETVAAPKVSTAYGRAVSKAKVKRGRITDRAKFIAALDEQSDFNEWLAEKANRLARAKTTLAGMEIYEE